MDFPHRINTAGDGYWSDSAKEVAVLKITVPYINEDSDFGELRVYFDPDSWNIKLDGLIYTDSNFLSVLQTLLVSAGLSSADVGYSEQGMQGENYVSLDVEARFLESWELKTNTLGGIRARLVSKEDALTFCHDHATQFIADNDRDQFDGLLVILESGTIDPVDLGDYGMNDQELEL